MSGEPEVAYQREESDSWSLSDSDLNIGVEVKKDQYGFEIWISSGSELNSLLLTVEQYTFVSTAVGKIFRDYVVRDQRPSGGSEPPSLRGEDPPLEHRGLIRRFLRRVW